jgi:hypothetical protein
MEESGTIDLIKSQLMENTATAGFNTNQRGIKDSDPMDLNPFDRDVNVNNKDSSNEINLLSPWDHKQRILMKNADGTVT